jgi:hypothetical protein
MTVQVTHSMFVPDQLTGINILFWDANSILSFSIHISKPSNKKSLLDRKIFPLARHAIIVRMQLITGKILTALLIWKTHNCNSQSMMSEDVGLTMEEDGPTSD